ncbi:MAG: hypothetical protein RR598_10720 [Anaerorhabdus sp.]
MKDNKFEELNKIYEWEDLETDKKIKELNAQGVFEEGLDAYSEYLKPIHEEAKRRFSELKNK